MPLVFEQNVGQTDPSVSFIAHGSGYTAFFTPTSAVLTLRAPGSKTQNLQQLLAPPSTKDAAVSIDSEGANASAVATGEDKLPSVANYFIGNESGQWHARVATYSKIRFANVYPGIDVEYYGTQQGLEYDYIVAPGADPSVIRVGYRGVTSLAKSMDGSVVLHTAVGNLAERAPTTYQDSGTGRRSVSSSFALSGIGVHLALGAYDRTQPLVIDPTIVYSSYLGGSSDDQDYTITTDPAGNIYAVGYTDGGGFPTSSAYQGTYGGGTHDISITKLTPGGGSYVYSTYLGGSGSDVGYSIAADATGDAYVVGMSTSSNYPTANAYSSSYSGSDYDGVVTKLSADGGTLDYSTYVGGNGYDELTGIAVNAAGNAYVTGYTSSTTFPTHNAIQSSNSGGYDVVLFELSPSGSTLVYGTYLGGSASDTTNFNDIAVDASGNVYVAETTSSTGLATAGAAQTTYGGGGSDGLVFKINAAGSAITWATYVGGSSTDYSLGLAIDASDNVYVGGCSNSTDFPTSHAIYGSNDGGYDGTVTELASSGGSWLYSTYIGGSSDDYLFGIAVDSAGDAYFGGYSSSTDYPTTNATQSSYPGGSYDGIYGEIGPGTGSSTPSLLVSSYLGGTAYSGGSDGTTVYGVSVDRSENLYLTGLTSSTNFPTASPLDGSYGGNPSDAYMTEISIGPATGALTATDAATGTPYCRACNSGVTIATATKDPINTESGNFFHTFDDISIPGRSYPMQITRTYNSQNASTNGPFGYGWSYNYGLSLAVTGSSPSQVATVTQEDGSQATFDQPASGSTWTPASAGNIATLTYNSGSSTWTLVRQGQDTYTFNSSGQLTEETDLNGYNTTLSYTGGDLTTVTDPAGRTLTIGWTGSNITSVTDANVSGNTRSVSYSYSGGDLVDVTDVNGGDTHFTYSSHLMTVMKDPVCEALGGSCPGVQNHYDGSNRVDWQKDQLNRETTFSYSGDPQSASGGTTLITDPASNETLDTYQWGVRTATTVGYGTSAASTTYFGYDPYTLALTSVRDPNGNLTTYTVDSNGNVLTETDPLGRVTTNTYNVFNEVLTTEDGNGVTTTNTYTGDGDLSSTKTPLVGSSPLVYQETDYAHANGTYPGDVTSMTDPDGIVSYYHHDSNGYVDEVKDPAGNVTGTVRNNDGWITASYTPKAGCTWNSSPPTGCSSSYETQYSYVVPGSSPAVTNEFGLAGTITDPLSHTVKNTYDADANTLTTTDGNGNQTSYTFDVANQLTTTTRPDSTTLVTDYNSDGTMSDQKDGASHAIITYGYNSRGQVTSSEDALSNTTYYTLDLDGNVLTKKDPVSGATCTGTLVGCTTYTYDADNEVKTVSYSDSSSENITSVSYDSDGQRTAMTDGTGSSSWAFDSLHRMTSYTNGNGASVTYGYASELKDQPITIAYPNSVGTVTQGWNTDGTLASVEDWNSKTIDFGYDANRNLDTITYPSTTTVTDTFGFNYADQMTSVSDSNGSTLFSANYTRNDNGQLASDDSVSSSVGSYKYNTLNQLCYGGSSTTNACSSPPSGSNAYAFSSADNMTTNNGNSQQFNNGDELCWSLPSGTSANACGSVPTGATTYGYSNTGNRIYAVPSTGPATCYGYDQPFRLTSIKTGTGSTCTSPTTVGTYAYDGDGLRESKTVSGTTTQFTWDGQGGNLLQQYDGTTKTSFIYGPGGIPVEQIAGSTTTYLHQDQLGSIRLITDSAGATGTATTQTWDPYGNSVSTSGSLTSPFGFSGQYTDSESGLIYLRARYYDPTTAQFLTVDPAIDSTISPYAYVAGNPLNATDPSGMCLEDACIGETAAAIGIVEWIIGLAAGGTLITGALLEGGHGPGGVMTWNDIHPAPDQPIPSFGDIGAQQSYDWSQFPGVSACAAAATYLGNISFAKKQPSTLSPAEQAALDNARNGDPFDPAAYNSAKQKLKQNEKYSGGRRNSQQDRSS